MSENFASNPSDPALPGIPGSDLADYEVLIERIVLPLRLLAIPGVFLEIGAYQGFGTAKLASLLKSRHCDKTLLVVDPFDPDVDLTRNSQGERMCDLYRAGSQQAGGYEANFKENTDGLENIEVFRGLSEDLVLADDQRIAFAFVDGGHSSRAVLRDFQLVWKHLSPGGVMAFHDYDGDLPGVTDTINRCLAKVAGEVRDIGKDPERWLIWVRKNG